MPGRGKVLADQFAARPTVAHATAGVLQRIRQTDVPMPPAGADNEQISTGQKCPPRRPSTTSLLTGTS